MTEQKSWVCESCGVIIGRIYYQSSVPVLRIEDVMLIGEAEIMCDCGHVNKWHPNAAALSHLIKDRKERQAAIREKINEIERGIASVT